MDTNFTFPGKEYVDPQSSMMKGYGGPGPGPNQGSNLPNKQATPHATSLFSPPQLQQLKAQIMAYRILSRSQILPPQIAAAVQAKRSEGPAPQTGTVGYPVRPPVLPQGKFYTH